MSLLQRWSATKTEYMIHAGPLDFNSAWATKSIFAVYPILLVLLCLFITFFLPTALAPYHERLTRYTTTLNARRRVTPSFSASYPPLSSTATINIFPYYSSFLSRSNRIATDKDFLETGPDGHVVKHHNLFACSLPLTLYTPLVSAMISFSILTTMTLGWLLQVQYLTFAVSLPSSSWPRH